jgi:superfamily II DNA or RNA helicase
MSGNWKHIDECNEVLTSNNDSGRIIMPTGSGKTSTEAEILRCSIIDNPSGISLVVAPRIALLSQLIEEYRAKAGQHYLALAFHSGTNETDYTKVEWDENSTTNPDEIFDEYRRAQELTKSLVLFSTYASLHKLSPFRFNLAIFDEAQYLVSEGYHEVAKNLKTDRSLFFTATQKYTKFSNGRGMNNIGVYGDILYQVEAKTLIDRRCIVKPRLHYMKATRADSKISTVIDEVINIAEKQSELTFADGMPVCKILYAMNGTSDVNKVIENIDCIHKKMPGFKVFTIISNKNKGAMVDGVKMTRKKFFKILRETDYCLIFHYDILSEGIDIDGITGVAILRSMTRSKLLQTIGRALRIYKANPELKKQAWVSVTSLDDDMENTLFIAEIISMLRDGGFDISKEDIEVTTTAGAGISDDEELDDAFNDEHKKEAQAELENIFHDVEQWYDIEEILSLSTENLMDKIA